jgi:RNA polymerase sigma factor (sigma-70 family)
MDTRLSIAHANPPRVEQVMRIAKIGAGLSTSLVGAEKTIAPKLSILERIAAGDNAAVKDCLDTYADLIWSLARRFLGNSEDLEDAVQDVFIEIWSNADRYKPEIAKEVTFIAMITRRRLIDRLRKKSRTPDSEEFDESIEYQNSEKTDVNSQTIDVQNVVNVLNGMPAQQSLILMLSIYQGYSHREIARKLDIPLGTVKTWIRRGMLHVREQLKLVA